MEKHEITFHEARIYREIIDRPIEMKGTLAPSKPCFWLCFRLIPIQRTLQFDQESALCFMNVFSFFYPILEALENL